MPERVNQGDDLALNLEAPLQEWPLEGCRLYLRNSDETAHRCADGTVDQNVTGAHPIGAVDAVDRPSPSLPILKRCPHSTAAGVVRSRRWHCRASGPRPSMLQPG
jgi:hypothetical protein